MPMPLITAEGVLATDPGAVLTESGGECATALLACSHGSTTVTLRVTAYAPALVETIAACRAGDLLTVTGRISGVAAQNQWARVTITAETVTVSGKASVKA